MTAMDSPQFSSLLIFLLSKEVIAMLSSLANRMVYMLVDSTAQSSSEKAVCDIQRHTLLLYRSKQPQNSFKINPVILQL